MQSIIITGAAGNLGKEVTRIFIQAGYKVIALVHDTAKAKQALLSSPQLFVVQADLSDEAGTAGIMKEILSNHENISGALLLAGGFAMGTIEQTGMNDIRKQIALNFETAYHVAQPAFLHMKEKGRGRIVFIGARPALEGEEAHDKIGYALSKSLLVKFSEQLNQSAEGKDVASYVIAPGIIDTPENRKAMAGANFSDWVSPHRLGELLLYLIKSDILLHNNVLKVFHHS